MERVFLAKQRLLWVFLLILSSVTASSASTFHEAKLEEAQKSFEQELIDLAIRQFKETLELAKGAQVEDITSIKAYYGLAECSLKKRRRLEALGHYKKALEICEKIEKSPWEETENTLSKIIPLANEEEQKKLLENSLEKWMTIINKRGDRKDQHLGHKIFNYGMILADNDYFGKAESMLLQSLKLFQKYLGANHRWVAQVHGHLAETYLSQKYRDYSKAEEHTSKELEMLEKKHDEYSMILVPVLKRFAAIRRFQSEWGPSAPPDARALYLRAIDIVQAKEGKDCLKLVSLYYELASVYRKLRQFKEARKYAQRGALIGERQENKDKRSAALPSMELLVALARKDGKDDEANYLEDRMVTIYLESAKIYPLDIIGWFAEISERLVKRGELERAVELFKKSAQRYRSRLGPSAEIAQKMDERAITIEKMVKARKED